MSTFLLDASVWLATLDTDDTHHTAAKRLVEASAAGDATLAALDLTLYEIANVAVTRWRSQDDAKRLAELVASACPSTLQRADRELLTSAAKIASDHGLTVYDAAYVACARRHEWTLVSSDVADLVRPGLALAPAAATETLEPGEDEENEEEGE